MSENADQDMLMFLDFDMSILGATEVEYVTYSQQIRYEYQHVPLGIYIQRRSEVLKGFLAYPAIFNSDSFRVTHEQTARNNIAREISRLTEVDESRRTRFIIFNLRIESFDGEMPLAPSRIHGPEYPHDDVFGEMNIEDFS